MNVQIRDDGTSVSSEYHFQRDEHWRGRRFATMFSFSRARTRALWGTCRSSSCCFGRIGERRCRKCEINASSNFAGRTMRFIHEFMDSRNKTDGITEECIIYASSSAFAAASLSCCQCHASLPFPAHVSRRPIFPLPPPLNRVQTHHIEF